MYVKEVEGGIVDKKFLEQVATYQFYTRIKILLRTYSSSSFSTRNSLLFPLKPSQHRKYLPFTNNISINIEMIGGNLNFEHH